MNANRLLPLADAAHYAGTAAAKIVAAGLPFEGPKRNRHYLPEVLDSWLLAQGTEAAEVGTDPTATRLTQAAAAEYVGVTERRLVALRIPWAGVAGRRTYRQDVLDRWLDDHGRTAAERRRRAAVIAHALYPPYVDADGMEIPVSKHRYYVTWKRMKARCTDPRDRNYPDYGARGIRVQASWLIDPAAFFQHVESLPKGPGRRTVDRIDNGGNYEEGNLRWATAQEQAANRRAASRDDDADERHDDCLCGGSHDVLSTCRLDDLPWDDVAAELGRRAMADLISAAWEGRLERACLCDFDCSFVPGLCPERFPDLSEGIWPHNGTHWDCPQCKVERLLDETLWWPVRSLAAFFCSHARALGSSAS